MVKKLDGVGHVNNRQKTGKKKKIIAMCHMSCAPCVSCKKKRKKKGYNSYRTGLFLADFATFFYS